MQDATCAGEWRCKQQQQQQQQRWFNLSMSTTGVPVGQEVSCGGWFDSLSVLGGHKLFGCLICQGLGA
jgi:hypothetical protein